MKTLSLVSLFLMVAGGAACGGSGTTIPPHDFAVAHDDFSAQAEDFSVVHDLSATPDLAKKTDGGTTPDGGGGTAMSMACLNICKCFMGANEQKKCNALCVADDARLYGFYFSGSGSSSGFSGSTSSAYTSYIAHYSGPLSGMFAGTSSLSSGDPVVPTNACLVCMSTATCSDLEEGNACLTQCPLLGE